jgi:hypothetical protein
MDNKTILTAKSVKAVVDRLVVGFADTIRVQDAVEDEAELWP